MKTYEVTTIDGRTQLIRADRVLPTFGWLFFLVKGREMWRFPAATTRFRELKEPPSQEPSTGSE